MAEYILSERAQNDLRRIWHYTVDTWSIEQAKRYYNEILDTCEAIANGQSRPGFRRAEPSDIPWPGVLQSIECSCRPFRPTVCF